MTTRFGVPYCSLANEDASGANGGFACYSPRSAMFITPGALEVVRRLAGSLLVSLGDKERSLTPESTFDTSDVSADMMAVL